jgi:hypothetical protein
MSVRQGATITISFPLIDSNSRPNRKTGLSFSAGQVQVSVDGGSFSNTTNLPSEIGATGRYKLDLTAPEMNGAWIHVKVAATGADEYDCVIGTTGNQTGLVVSDGGNTALTFKTDLTQAVDDYWKDVLLLFTTGSFKGQLKKINAYSGTTKFVTLTSAFTGTPAAGDRFILVNI